MLRRFPVIAVFLALFALAAAACGSSGGSSGGSSATLSISSPADGATTAAPFWVTVKSSVPLGAPSTGRHHVHIWFDGHQDQYTLGYSDRVQITSVPPGQHKMTVSLRNPNHSAAGVDDKTITITVSSGTTAPSSSQAPTYGSSSGYGY